ncbi:DUF6879 family protein [Streptomyces bacillaris]
MPQSVSFDELLKSARHSAVHLEMRDAYGVGDEAADFATWRRTGQRDTDPASAYWTPWVDLVQSAVSRGVAVRRAHVVSEPVTEYIRYEHAGTVVNILAGEQVRWLPRRQAVELMLPGSDLWIFDGQQVLFNHFTGSGDWSDPGLELRTEPHIVKQCADAFEAVCARATPHDQYALS